MLVPTRIEFRKKYARRLGLKPWMVEIEMERFLPIVKVNGQKNDNLTRELQGIINKAIAYRVN